MIRINQQKALKRDFIYNMIYSSKKGFQAFIYIYYKIFDKHRCSSPTGFFLAFCINIFFSEIQLDLMCELLTWVAHAMAQLFGSPPPLGIGEGPKGQISLNLKHKVNYKDFKPNFVCLLTNERYKTYQTGFSFGRLGHAPRGETLGCCVGLGSKFFPRNSTRFGVWVT